MKAKIGVIFLLVLLAVVSLVHADPYGGDYKSGPECDPVKVAMIGIQTECNVNGNPDTTTTISASINGELARRKCTERTKPFNICKWTDEDLKKCEAVVVQYCDTFNKEPQLQEKDESGVQTDRNVQNVIEEGGILPPRDDGTEAGTPTTPTEDTGAQTGDTTGTTGTTPATTGTAPSSRSGNWLWWVILIVIIVAAVWYFMSNKKGSSKPAKAEAKPAAKAKKKR